MDYNQFFLEKAFENRDILLSHEVLSKYSDKISIIMKGSTARRCADSISDTDIVIFTDEKHFEKIITEYYNLGLCPNPSGIFLPLPYGHYNLDRYSSIEKYIKDEFMPQIWEYSNVDFLHDPYEIFENLTMPMVEKIFTPQHSVELILKKYIDIQLTADWMGQPLKRADYFAAFLHYSKFIQLVAHICFLIDKKPYPHDKWLGFYLPETDLGKEIAPKLLSYMQKTSEKINITPMQELEKYVQYEEAMNIIEYIKEGIRSKYENFAWIEQWTCWA